MANEGLSVDDVEKLCWICLDLSGESALSEWVAPCKCRGATKWVHQSCVQEWVLNTLRQNPLSTPECCMCTTPYIFEYPNMGILFSIASRIRDFQMRLGPYILTCIIGASTLWSISCESPFTDSSAGFVQCNNQTTHLINPSVFFVGLPAFPIVLTLHAVPKWDDLLLKFLYTVSRNYPILRPILPVVPNEIIQKVYDREAEEHMVFCDSGTLTTALSTVVFMPIIASTLGNMLDSNYSETTKFFIGGGLYILGRGLFNMFYKHKKMVQHERQRLCNYIN